MSDGRSPSDSNIGKLDRQSATAFAKPSVSHRFCKTNPIDVENRRTNIALWCALSLSRCR
jgi:hypothetical protein